METRNSQRDTIHTGKVKSTPKQIVVMIIWLVILFVICFQVAKFVGYTIGKLEKKDMHVYNAIDSVMQKIIKKLPNTKVEEKTLKLAALGNIYVTPNILSGAKSSNTYDFVTGTEALSTKLKEYDVVLASLNTPIANKSLGYSTTKLYNAPSELTKLLTSLQVSYVATATAHAMDKNFKGITDTIETLETANIKQTGISKEGRSKPLIVSKNEINIGLLSYTTKTNVKIDKTAPSSLNVLDEQSLKEDMAYLKENKVDKIIAYLDVSGESSTMLSSQSKQNVDLLMDAGVNIVLGSGVAYVQDDYEDEIELEDKSKSHVYTVYALGDVLGSFAEYQSTIVPTFEFTKTITKNKKGEVVNTQNDVKIKTPLMVWTSVDKSYATTMYLMEDEVAKYNTDQSKMAAKEYTAMKKEYDRILKLYE